MAMEMEEDITVEETPEMEEDTMSMFDGPIPGSSLTEELGSEINERPPVYTEPDEAYEFVMNKMTPNENNMMGTSSPDFSNFQEQIVDEVTEKNVPGANEDNMMESENIFELGSGNLAGSVSETDYTAPNIEGTNPRGKVSSARSTPLIGGDPNVPYGYEENILDVLAEDNMANGGYMRNFPNQNLNTESLSASDNIDNRIMKNLEFEKMSPGMMGYNTGGRVMSTYDKLKAIADNNYG